MKTEAYIVLGPSRSGTSLAMGLLSSMGVHLGDNLKMEGINNPCYYEDMDLIDLLVYRKNVDPRDIVKRLAVKPKWGMKLPRLLFHWDLFAPFIPNPRFVVARRSLDSIADSQVATMHRNPKEKALASALRQYALIASYAEPRFDIRFEDWFNDKRDDQLQRLADFAGLSVTTESRELIQTNLKRF